MLPTDYISSCLVWLLCFSSVCWTAAAQPRKLLTCPSDFETLIEPLPASVGDPVLLAGPGVRMRTVEFLQDTVLRVEYNRVLLNQSINATEGPSYNGPHVILCSDAEQPLVTFSLFFNVSNDGQVSTALAQPVGGMSFQEPTDEPSKSKSATATTAPGNTENPNVLLLVCLILVPVLFILCLILGAALACCHLRHRQRAIIYTGPRGNTSAGTDKLQLLASSVSLTSNHV